MRPERVLLSLKISPFLTTLEIPILVLASMRPIPEFCWLNRHTQAFSPHPPRRLLLLPSQVKDLSIYPLLFSPSD